MAVFRDNNNNEIFNDDDDGPVREMGEPLVYRRPIGSRESSERHFKGLYETPFFALHTMYNAFSKIVDNEYDPEGAGNPEGVFIPFLGLYVDESAASVITENPELAQDLLDSIRHEDYLRKQRSAIPLPPPPVREPPRRVFRDEDGYEFDQDIESELVKLLDEDKEVNPWLNMNSKGEVPLQRPPDEDEEVYEEPCLCTICIGELLGQFPPDEDEEVDEEVWFYTSSIGQPLLQGSPDANEEVLYEEPCSCTICMRELLLQFHPDENEEVNEGPCLCEICTDQRLRQDSQDEDEMVEEEVDDFYEDLDFSDVD